MGSFVDRLKEHFNNTPKEELDKEWNELKHLNEIGPDVIKYYEYYKKVFENGTLDSKR